MRTLKIKATHPWPVLRMCSDYAAAKVQTLCASQDEQRARWADAGQRADIIQQLAERGIDFPTVAAQAGKPKADPFDLPCHLAFNAPVLTRRQRADRVNRQHSRGNAETLFISRPP